MKRFRQAIAIVLLSCTLAACSTGKNLATPRTEESSPSAQTADVTLGAVSIDDGVLTVGTGTGTFTMRIGAEAQLSRGSFAETGSVGIELTDSAGATLRLAPQRGQMMAETEFAELLISQGATSAEPLGVERIGQSRAVGADAVDPYGTTRRIYLVWINGEAWTFTIVAPTVQERTRLETIAHTLETSALPSEGGDFVGGLDVGPHDFDDVDSSVGVGGTMVSADGELTGKLSSDYFVLTAPGTTLRFEAEGMRSVSSDAEGNYIGIERDGVILVFSTASEGNAVSGEDLAEQLRIAAEGAAGESVVAESLGENTIAGFPAVGARVVTPAGASRRLYIIDTGSGYLAALIQTPDLENMPDDAMIAVLLKGVVE